MRAAVAAAIVLAGVGAEARAAVGLPTCAAYTPDRTVCATGCTDIDIADAVGAAANDDVICVASGTYTDDLTVDGRHVVVVEADGADVSISLGNGIAIVEVRNQAELELVGVTVRGNPLRGCLYVRDTGSSVVLDAATVEECTSEDDGPAVQLDQGASLTTRNGTVFRKNGDPTVLGGAVAQLGSGTVTLEDTTFEENSADDGGAIWLGSGSLVVTRGTFAGNTASDRGGAIHAIGTARVTVVDSTFDGNTAVRDGGAVTFESSLDLDVAGTAFVANVADLDGDLNGDGGAIALAVGQARIDGCAFEGNTADDGGAIDADGAELVLLRSTFCGDTANDQGGAVAADALLPAAYVANNVFQGHAAAAGGALSVTGTLSVRFNTFLASDAAGGADAVSVEGAGTVTLDSNLLAWHPDTAASRTLGSVASNYNAWWSNGQDATGFPLGVGEVTGADPLLASFTDDGLCNDVPVPLVGSPLVDAGNPAYTDPDGGPSDIGAYGGPEAPSTDADADGALVGADCDDDDATVYPGAAEVPCDGLDQDCDAATSDTPDGDADGVGLCDGDCDDAATTIAPGLAETPCNAVDDDCDPSTPDEADDDGDTFSQCDGDCDDANGAVHPGAADPPGDGVDGDCDGADDATTDTDPTRPTTPGDGGPMAEDAVPGAFVPHGCGCASRATGGGQGLLVGALLAARRRRRPWSR